MRQNFTIVMERRLAIIRKMVDSFWFCLKKLNWSILPSLFILFFSFSFWWITFLEFFLIHTYMTLNTYLKSTGEYLNKKALILLLWNKQLSPCKDILLQYSGRMFHKPNKKIPFIITWRFTFGTKIICYFQIGI